MNYSIENKLYSLYETKGVFEKGRYTSIKQFLDSIGIDHTTATTEQKEKWMRSKRYKQYLAMHKLQRIADELKKKKEVSENLNLFIKLFYYEDIFMDEITAMEAKSFLVALNELAVKKMRISLKPVRTYGHRGEYKSKAQRQAELQQKIIDTVNAGGVVSTMPGDVLFSGKYKHSKHGPMASRTGRIVLKRRTTSAEGSKYRRKTYKDY